MIVFFTDFGLNGPYLGQIQASIYSVNPTAKIINLVANAPMYNPAASAHLLSAFVSEFPESTVFLAVIDPGVGSAHRRPIVAEIDSRFYVGPDNGLFDIVAARAKNPNKREINWRPKRLSASFHGRDLFAPVAAYLENATLPTSWLSSSSQFTTAVSPDDLLEIIYIDDYGNAMTGLRAGAIRAGIEIMVNDYLLKQARTFSDVTRGQAFWYINSNGMVELAVNCGNAVKLLDLSVGMPFEIVHEGG